MSLMTDRKFTDGKFQLSSHCYMLIINVSYLNFKMEQKFRHMIKFSRAKNFVRKLKDFCKHEATFNGTVIKFQSMMC